MPNQARDAQGDTATACGINPIKLFRELDSALDDKPILVADGGDFVATSATPCVRGIGKTAFRKRLGFNGTRKEGICAPTCSAAAGDLPPWIVGGRHRRPRAPSIRLHRQRGQREHNRRVGGAQRAQPEPRLGGRFVSDILHS